MSGAGRRGDSRSWAKTQEPEVDPQDDIQTANPHIYFTDADDFYDTFGEELVIAYHCLIDQCSQNGYPFFHTLSFHDFVEITYRHSSKIRPTLY